MIGMRSDYLHRVAGVSHLRKNDQLDAGLFGVARKVANLEEIRLRITERTRNLGNGNFHLNVILIPQWREKNLGSILERSSQQKRGQRCFAPLNMTVPFMMNCKWLVKRPATSAPYAAIDLR
jgi:hypothetical protein